MVIEIKVMVTRLYDVKGVHRERQREREMEREGEREGGRK
jgi:hypothetical protein